MFMDEKKFNYIENIDNNVFQLENVINLIIILYKNVIKGCKILGKFVS